jgi:hypothetical protein
MDDTSLCVGLEQCLVPETYERSVSGLNEPLCLLLTKQDIHPDIVFLAHPRRYALAVARFNGDPNLSRFLRSLKSQIRERFPYVNGLGSYPNWGVSTYLVLITSNGFDENLIRSTSRCIRDPALPVQILAGIASLLASPARENKSVSIRRVHYIDTVSRNEGHCNAWGKPDEVEGFHLFDETNRFLRVLLETDGDPITARRLVVERRLKSLKDREEQIAYANSTVCPRCDQRLRSRERNECPHCGWMRYPSLDKTRWGQAGSCPQCGFTYRWDGQNCSHCGHRTTKS